MKSKKLDKVLSGLDPSVLEAMRKTEQINLRVSPDEKRSLQETAERLKMTLTEYILTVHSYVVRNLK